MKHPRENLIVQINNAEPNRLLGTEVFPISVDPNLGWLELETDQGSVVVLVNEAGAEQLIKNLQEFLLAEERDINPKLKVRFSS